MYIIDHDHVSNVKCDRWPRFKRETVEKKHWFTMLLSGDTDDFHLGQMVDQKMICDKHDTWTQYSIIVGRPSTKLAQQKIDIG